MIVSITYSSSLQLQAKQQAKQQDKPRLARKKILMVISPSDFRDEELSVPKKLFEQEGAKVDVGCEGTSEARGMLGMRVKPDVDIAEIDVSDYTCVVFVGGNGVDKHRTYEDSLYVELAKSSYSSCRAIGAICLAPKILANAGLLEGRNATVFSAGADYLREHGARYTGRSVEVDGRIVTGNGPAAAEKFARQIIELVV